MNEAQVDATFRALSDPTRRAVIQRLCVGPASMTELSQPFPIKLPTFSKHLDVLEECGLVKSTKVGRVRTYRLVPKRLTQAEDWLSKQRRAWERRLDQLDEYLKTMTEQ